MSMPYVMSIHMSYVYPYIYVCVSMSVSTYVTYTYLTYMVVDIFSYYVSGTSAGDRSNTEDSM